MSTSDPGRPTSTREAYQALAAAQKAPHGTAAYSRFVNRPWGRLIASWAAVRGLTPNGVTGLSALASLAAIGLIACVRPAPYLGVLVAFLLCLGYALDSADGQVARLTGGGSALGEWLDHMVDCAKINLLHIATAISLVRFTDLPLACALVPLGYLAVQNVTFFGMMLIKALRQPTGNTTKSQSLSVIRSLVLLPSDYGALCLVFIFLPWTSVYLVFYGAMGACAALLLVAGLVSWFRELNSAAQARVVSSSSTLPHDQDSK